MFRRKLWKYVKISKLNLKIIKIMIIKLLLNKLNLNKEIKA